MSIEVRPCADLPPNVCGVCGCSEEGEHIFVNGLMTWEGKYLFICRKCVTEMAQSLKVNVTSTVEKVVEVPQAPTAEEILAVIGAKFTLTPHIQPDGKGDSDGGDALLCVCGKEFTGPTAAAKLGTHKRTCQKAKEATGHVGD